MDSHPVANLVRANPQPLNTLILVIYLSIALKTFSLALACLALFGLCASSVAASGVIHTHAVFSGASMDFNGSLLRINTGTFSRVWRVTRGGLTTVRLGREGATIESMQTDRNEICDWDLGLQGDADLVTLAGARDDDESFTDPHLRVVAEFEYPTDRVAVRYVVWAYPGAHGLRTQVEIRALPGYRGTPELFGPQIVETLRPSTPFKQRIAFGLIQGIKANTGTQILREEAVGAGEISWANGVVLQGDKAGLVVVKESNKHTHQSAGTGRTSGGLRIGDGRVEVTGAGMLRGELSKDRYRKCWATWVVPYTGDTIDAELALKRFDRRRFPVVPERDVYMMANTWGSEDERPACIHAAREDNVLEELESVADLGIDVLQIDDGWQTPRWTAATSATRVQHGRGAVEAFGDYPVYPDGWKRVRGRAAELGVDLGLWAAWTAPLDALVANHDQAEFRCYKLDFANLNSKARYDGLVEKARALIKHSGGSARVNWDVTETVTRMGYFTGREYGNVYLANRKTMTARAPVLYVPHKVLNEAWNLSKYVNLNKFQVTVQNVDRVLPGVPTDAAQHTHDYAVGIALMSCPIFFQETRYYEPEARERVREILSVYKAHREAMYRGYVFPIGDEPDNHSLTGFQNHDPGSGSGYITAFRERLCPSAEGDLRLAFVAGQTLEFTDLLTKDNSLMTVSPDGDIELTIPKAPGFRFIRYRPAPVPARDPPRVVSRASVKAVD